MVCEDCEQEKEDVEPKICTLPDGFDDYTLTLNLCDYCYHLREEEVRMM